MDPDQTASEAAKPADLDLQCFQKRINLGSAGQGLRISIQPLQTRPLSFITKYMYSKACLKRPLKNRQNKGLNDNGS